MGNPPSQYFSFTQISVHNRCKFLWQLQWQRRIEALMPEIRIDLGSIVHAGLARYFRDKYWIQVGDLEASLDFPARSAHDAIDAWADEHFPGWREMVSDYTADNSQTLEDILDLMENSEGSFSVTDKLAMSAVPVIGRAHELLDRTIAEIGDKWEVMGHEGEPIVERVFTYAAVKCVVDLVIRDRDTQTVLIVDFKVRGKLQPPMGTDYDLQTAIYQYVLARNGVTTNGSAILQIRSITPRQPKLNKKDGMSRSDIVTDWATYKQALEDNGLDPADYADMQIKLGGKAFFMMTRTYRGAARQAAIWREVIMPTLHEIRLAKRRYRGGKIAAPRNMSAFNCSSCRFASLCMAELEGMDTTYMFGTMFKDKSDAPTTTDEAPTSGEYSLDPFATTGNTAT